MIRAEFQFDTDTHQSTAVAPKHMTHQNDERHHLMIMNYSHMSIYYNENILIPPDFNMQWSPHDAPDDGDD